MNKIKTADALEYALARHAEYAAKAEITLAIHRAKLEKQSRSIWCRWFKLKPEGLSVWNYGWVDVSYAEMWAELVDMLKYHTAMNHSEVEIPFNNTAAFYTWARENGKP